MDLEAAYELFFEAFQECHLDHIKMRDHGANSLMFTPEEWANLRKCVGRVEREKKKVDTDTKVPYTQVMDLMRQHAGVTSRRPVASKYKTKIRALWKRGVTLADFEAVFRYKYNEYRDRPEWLGRICNPETLLGKFDKYLAEASHGKTKPKPKLHRADNGGTHA